VPDRTVPSSKGAAEGPSPTPETDSDDLFRSIEKARGALPPGEYVAELATALPFDTPKTSGATALVKIVEGEYRGREIRLRFVENGPPTIDGIIARDASALHAWWEAVEAEGRPSRKDGFAGALKAIWTASRDKRVVIKLGQTTRAGVIEMHLIGVRVDDPYPF
jgi:hypothetical protein